MTTRMERTDTAPIETARSRKMSGLLGGAIIAVVAIGVLFSLGWRDHGVDTPIALTASSGDALTGTDFANSIGLKGHAFDPSMKLSQTSQGLMLNGSLLSDCATPPNGDPWAFSVLPDDVLYCYTASTEIEVWVIGQRLAGHVPTADEIAEQRAELSGRS